MTSDPVYQTVHSLVTSRVGLLLHGNTCIVMETLTLVPTLYSLEHFCVLQYSRHLNTIIWQTKIFMQTPWTRAPSVSRWSFAFPRAHWWPTAAMWPDISVISTPVMFGIIEKVLTSRSTIYNLFKCFLFRISINQEKPQFYRWPNI